MSQMIFGQNGRRKYLTKRETTLFLDRATKAGGETLTLCWVISATGCRISEALALCGRSIDIDAKMIVFETLKKRKKGVFRAVPVPANLIYALVKIHGLVDSTSDEMAESRLWQICRMTAYRRIKGVMSDAGVQGLHAMPKGLRHGFGVAAIQSDVPLNLVQRWLGHADMRTTAIYTSAMGAEERKIASKMWKTNDLYQG